MRNQYVYGPVPSRRLGRSLGVNPIPFKTCNHSCVYCQLGRTTRLTNTRKDFFPPRDILQETRRALEQCASDADYVTFVGEGEPTLCSSLGYLLDRTRQIAGQQVAVVTNGSLLCRKTVREELSRADLVMPSLDAADQETFQMVNRPHRTLRIAEIIDGMARFRESFQGQLWVEIMLVRGINDLEENLLGIREALNRIEPNRIYVNVPVRPPAEGWVVPPDAQGLVRARAILPKAIFIDRPESGEFSTAGFDDPVAAVLMIIRRHPMRWEQIQTTLDMFSPEEIAAALNELEASGQVQEIPYRLETYYATGEGRYVSKHAGSRSASAEERPPEP